MDIKKLIETMSISENLKNYTRHSWTSTLRQESIAEHSWRLSLMAYFISLSKASKKAQSLINPVLNAQNDTVIKTRLLQLYKKYNY